MPESPAELFFRHPISRPDKNPNSITRVNSKLSAERVEYLRALSAVEAVRLLIKGEFVMGEDEYLVDIGLLLE